MNKGCLVRLKNDCSYSAAGSMNCTGLTLSEPEIFGFIQRVHVMWSGEETTGMFLEEWVDLEDIIVLRDPSEE
jgi:hypothetical protein